MDFNLGMRPDARVVTKETPGQDARRRMAAKLLEPEQMPGQISSPGAARGLVLASALKNIAGVALQPGAPQPGAPQPGAPLGAAQPGADWGQLGQWFSSLLNRQS